MANDSLFKPATPFTGSASTLAIAVALISLFPRPRLTQLTVFQREGLCLAAASFAALGLVQWRFCRLPPSISGFAPYPSREHPYFTFPEGCSALPQFHSQLPCSYAPRRLIAFCREFRDWPKTILFACLVLFHCGFARSS